MGKCRSGDRCPRDAEPDSKWCAMHREALDGIREALEREAVERRSRRRAAVRNRTCRAADCGERVTRTEKYCKAHQWLDDDVEGAA